MKKNNSNEDLEGLATKACQACGGNLQLEKVNLEDFQEGKLYIMEKVPAYVCEECGEVWVPEPIMKEFEKMIETARKRKTKKRRKAK
jgi:YgiT-type zinc finger domain-containing protein